MDVDDARDVVVGPLVVPAVVPVSDIVVVSLILGVVLVDVVPIT